LAVTMSLGPLGHVTIYGDEPRREPLLRVLQDQRVAFLTRTYTIVTGAGDPLAKLRKTYLHNVIRKRWYVLSPTGALVAMAVEDSMVLSLLRRGRAPLLRVLLTDL